MAGYNSKVGMLLQVLSVSKLSDGGGMLHQMCRLRECGLQRCVFQVVLALLQSRAPGAEANGPLRREQPPDPGSLCTHSQPID